MVDESNWKRSGRAGDESNWKSELGELRNWVGESNWKSRSGRDVGMRRAAKSRAG